MNKKNKTKINKEIVEILIGESNDKYAINYKKRLASTIISCFLCNAELSQFSIKCQYCNYTYHYCKCCSKDFLTYLYGFNCCIFCHRKTNDKLVEIFNSLKYKVQTIPIKNDMYGRDTINSFVNNFTK